MSVTAGLTIRVGCEFVLENQSALPTHAVFLVRPDAGASDVRSEAWSTEPPTAHRDYRDLYGNICRRVNLAPGTTSVHYDATVGVPGAPAESDPSAREVPVDELPDDALIYTLPSRLCPSDLLIDRAWELFGAVEPGWARVQAICDWTHAHVRFSYGTSRPHTTAVDVIEAATGVCRDFAQVAVSLCRALNIPARYCFGYLPDIGVPPPDAEMDFCAWFEAYLGGRWWTFDPRNNQRRIGNVLIGRGRDAVDVAMLTTYGSARLDTMTVWADEMK